MTITHDPVLVRAAGYNGVGKSTTINGVLGYPVGRSAMFGFTKHKEFFKAGQSSEGIPADMSKTVPVRQDLLPEGAPTLMLSDSYGLGDAKDTGAENIDKLLGALRDKPATLLIVSTFARTDLTFIRFIKLLSICTNMDSDNSFLVFTKAADMANDVLASEADPTMHLEKIKQATGVACFTVGKNVKCIDLDPGRDAALDWIRKNLVTQRPIQVHCTYSELLQMAKSGSEGQQAAYNTSARKLAAAKDDLAWHAQRIKDLSIATASTAWIPFAGWISGVGMAAAIAHSQHQVTMLPGQIAEIEKEMENSAKNQKAWQDKLAMYQGLIMQ